MDELKQKIEALLFSSGRKMPVDEIARLCHKHTDKVEEALRELKKEYDEKNSSLMVVEEGTSWKLTVREEHLSLVQNIVTKTEMSRTLMETLAVIAFKYPIKQSNLIKIRTNKAYDHLRELEEMGYITRQKYGRTNLIKLTEKFFEYFSLSEDKLKGHMEDFSSIAKAIEEKEAEIKKTKEAMKEQAIKEGAKKESKAPEVDLLDEKGEPHKLEVYRDKNARKKHVIEPYEEKLGSLEVIDEPEEESKGEEAQDTSGLEEPAEEGGVEESDDVDKRVEALMQEAREEVEQEKKEAGGTEEREDEATEEKEESSEEEKKEDEEPAENKKAKKSDYSKSEQPEEESDTEKEDSEEDAEDESKKEEQDSEEDAGSESEEDKDKNKDD